jgi:translation initiation factor 2 beta subunit (eIF-2beta)/eIF-5
MSDLKVECDEGIVILKISGDEIISDLEVECDEENIVLKISGNEIMNNLIPQDEIYNLLLNDIYESIELNTELFGNKGITITRPHVIYKNRKTIWINYGVNCKQINCSKDHINKYIEKELGVKTSVNIEESLLIRGKFDSKAMFDIYKKYTKHYIQCGTCKSINTKIIRDNHTRLDNIKCLNKNCNTIKAITKL